jgi:hypothetical protein
VGRVLKPVFFLQDLLPIENFSGPGWKPVLLFLKGDDEEAWKKISRA